MATGCAVAPNFELLPNRQGTFGNRKCAPIRRNGLTDHRKILETIAREPVQQEFEMSRPATTVVPLQEMELGIFRQIQTVRRSYQMSAFRQKSGTVGRFLMAAKVQTSDAGLGAGQCDQRHEPEHHRQQEGAAPHGLQSLVRPEFDERTPLFIAVLSNLN